MMPGIEQLAKKVVPGLVRIGSPSAIQGLPPEMQNAAFASSVGILIWSVRHRGETRAYGSKGKLLEPYRNAFNRLSTTAESGWRNARQRLSQEFKKIYA